MINETFWKRSSRPNYRINVDKQYPYSELPHMGEYSIVKIPFKHNDFVDHVDYWGKGRLSDKGTRGFSNCYNVNLTYELVYCGLNKYRKVPNRIPVISYYDCDTSAYIKENSVLIVTVMGRSVSSNCAADITRIVNKDTGIVVAYGYKKDSHSIDILTEHLKEKGMYQSFTYELPDKLKEITHFESRKIFLNTSLIKTELYRLITKGDFVNAVLLSINFIDNVNNDVIEAVLDKILNSDDTNPNKIMTYAYYLWKNGGKDVVINHFPTSFKLILGKEKVKIVNKVYNQAMKLGKWMDAGDIISLGDNDKKIKASWQFNPIYFNDNVIFTMFNIESNMHLMTVIEESNEDGKTYRSIKTETDKYRYILEPCLKQGVLYFHIINYETQQGLKLEQRANSCERRVLGHNGEYVVEDCCKWVISEYITNFKDML